MEDALYEEVNNGTLTDTPLCRPSSTRQQLHR